MLIMNIPAYDLLIDPAKRRLYDSIDGVEDEVPPVTKYNKDNFYRVFAPIVVANSRLILLWSTII